MSALTARDPFIVKLLEALGVPVERLRGFSISGSGPDAIVSVMAEYVAEKPDAELTARAFELHRTAALEGALAELAGGKIRALELAEGDTLVYRTPERLSAHQLQGLTDFFNGEFPGHEVLILDGGVELQIVRAPDSPIDTRTL